MRRLEEAELERRAAETMESHDEYLENAKKLQVLLEKEAEDAARKAAIEVERERARKAREEYTQRVQRRLEEQRRRELEERALEEQKKEMAAHCLGKGNSPDFPPPIPRTPSRMKQRLLQGRGIDGWKTPARSRGGCLSSCSASCVAALLTRSVANQSLPWRLGAERAFSRSLNAKRNSWSAGN